MYDPPTVPRASTVDSSIKKPHTTPVAKSRKLLHLGLRKKSSELELQDESVPVGQSSLDERSKVSITPMMGHGRRPSGDRGVELTEVSQTLDDLRIKYDDDVRMMQKYKGGRERHLSQTSRSSINFNDFHSVRAKMHLLPFHEFNDT